ncbi:hypothetical protein LRHMDP3_2761 [Lacticaseibacillus rhamnosus LRHMDP3]|uniref:Uncharacterized protein n=1 Tax=Lacticaseibacillus rhamnosus LRHMDP3 TaxID=1203259 RepID=A0AB33XQU1_LACRH|nr:hypothetical protein LRHMDP3_2761 [Lacticaseibacillus rhamnosus LRHMDP3]
MAATCAVDNAALMAAAAELAADDAVAYPELSLAAEAALASEA